MIPLDKFRMGYFILYRNDNSFFSKGIIVRQLAAGFSKEAAQFTHIEVSGGEIHSINISPPISKLIEITKHHKGRFARLVRFKNEEYEKSLRYKIAYFSATLCNKGYDIGGILAFMFKWIKQNNRLYFCSEGCAYSLRMVFSNALGNLENSQVMPAHFLNPNEFERVWEGKIE